MITFLFWNLNARPLQNLLATLAQDHSVDVIILAECKIPFTDLLLALNAGQRRKYVVPFSLPSRLVILTSLPHNSIKPVQDLGHITVRRVFPPVGVDVILVAVHLSSKLFQDTNDQALATTRLARLIEEIEKKIGHSRTIIVGDLNMNPFEAGVAGAEALHGVMSKNIANKGSRVVGGEEKKFFYNPMWGRFGDYSPGPPGTYFNAGARQINYFWNMFDQVLFRPELLLYFQEDFLDIPTVIGSTLLLSDKGIPNRSIGSDHLPILFRLNL